jgi:transposase
MSNKPTIMLRLKRVLQLLINGESKSAISRKVPIHRSILDKYLAIFDQSIKSYAELLILSDQDLEKIINPVKDISENERLIHLQELIPSYTQELSKVGVTLKLLWEEYIEQQPNGYRYAQFCIHFVEYRKRHSATMHFDHIAGEKLEVDFAGSQLSYVNTFSGEIIYCPVLVCTLPFSGYTYVEALIDAKQENLFLALGRCLLFLGGVTRNVKSDNMRQFITKNSRYEFTFTELAEQWSLFYNTALAATRPRKPKDKPTVENSVYHSYLRIFAPLRNKEFHSLNDLNEGILDQLDKHNDAGFQKKPGSRTKLFLLHEKSTLGALPKDAFSIKHTVNAKVQKNYHIILGEDNHQYSVPFTHIGKQTRVVYDHQEVEIFIGLKRIALHKRNSQELGYTTLKEHMPSSHQKQTEAAGWNADFFLEYAQSIGPDTTIFYTKLMDNSHFVEQTYRACMGIKFLGTRYGIDRLESACGRAIKGKISYGSLKKILDKKLDLIPLPESMELPFEIQHDNIRGPEAYF